MVHCFAKVSEEIVYIRSLLLFSDVSRIYLSITGPNQPRAA